MKQFLGLAIMAFLPGCGEVDEAGANALWDEIHAKNYPTWQRAPGYEQPQPTVGAHGDTAVVFIDDTVAQALESPGLASWPEGALIVKDIFEDGDRTLVAAMKKKESGWFFAEWEPDGDPDYAGLEIDVCTECHTRSNDRVRAFSLP